MYEPKALDGDMSCNGSASYTYVYDCRPRQKGLYVCHKCAYFYFILECIMNRSPLWSIQDRVLGHVR